MRIAKANLSASQFSPPDLYPTTLRERWFSEPKISNKEDGGFDLMVARTKLALIRNIGNVLSRYALVWRLAYQ